MFGLIESYPRDTLDIVMATNLLVVTPSPTFGEYIRRSLEETESYHVFVVNSKAAAIVRADEESCKMAFLDLDLGEQWVEDVGTSLRTIIPNIKLFILVEDETPPAFDTIRPWTLVRKPLQIPDLLQILARPVQIGTSQAPKPEAGKNLPWLSDVNKAAQHLTRLTLESASQAALITRENEVWAYAGQLSQAAAQEVAQTLARNWDDEKGGDLLRFVRLESTKAEHMLYATLLSEGMLLAMVFDAETPFSTIRSQASQLANSLEENESNTDNSDSSGLRGSTTQETDESPMNELDDEEGEGVDIPPISAILTDIPAPDPRLDAESPRMESTPSTPYQESVHPIDTGETRPSTYLHEPSISFPSGELISTHEQMSNIPVDSTEGQSAAPSAGGNPPGEQLDATRVSRASPRPETPIRRPLAAGADLDETRPHSAEEAGSIVLEPISAGVYHLAYACLLVPRFMSHYLTGDIADKLSEWLPIICVAFGWRLEYLAVRPEYLQWVANVPPATSPAYVMRVMRQQVSDKIFTAFPRLKRENPSGDFWAPGYLIMGGAQPHPPQLVKDYIRQIRQRQGVEKSRR